MTEFLYTINGGLIFVLLVVVFLVVKEIGYFLGRRSARQQQGSTNSQMQAIEAAMLTLLGLLLAFTFSMAATRYDARKNLVLEEANAMGTSFLRASLLPPPARSDMENVLREYAQTRLEYYRAPFVDDALRIIETKTDELQRHFWDLASEEGRNRSTPTMALLLASLNEVIDDREKQNHAFENHVPENILIFLLLVSVLVLGIVGYLNGLIQERERFPSLILAVVIGMTIYLVVDLDRPRRGLIRLSHESLVRLNESINKK